VYLHDFVAALHLQMHKCANILSRPFFVSPQSAYNAVSQFFLVDTPVDSVIEPHPRAAKRVSKLSLRHQCAYKRGLCKMDPQAKAGAAAKECTKRKKLHQERLATCSWRQHKTPPPARKSPPWSSKSAACTSIASQLQGTPCQERDGFVPVVTVVKDLRRCNLVGSESTAVGCTVDPSHRPAYSPRSSSSNVLVLYAEHGNPLALDALNSPTATNKTDGVPSDFNEPTSAEVGKWFFYECLIHYMDGEKISHSNCKAVELVILIKAGMYVHGLNPMRKAQMGEIILTKYQGLIEGIKNHHFPCETVRDSMLKGVCVCV
jgi:hypothetical protein